MHTYNTSTLQYHVANTYKKLVQRCMKNLCAKHLSSLTSNTMVELRNCFSDFLLSSQTIDTSFISMVYNAMSADPIKLTP